jgi:uncharacterized protein
MLAECLPSLQSRSQKSVLNRVSQTFQTSIAAFFVVEACLLQDLDRSSVASCNQFANSSPPVILPPNTSNQKIAQKGMRHVLNPELLKLLICPETGQPLILANEDLLSALNLEIEQGKVCNLAGIELNQPLEEGLVREDRQILYPILDGIPALLNDEAIKLSEYNV